MDPWAEFKDADGGQSASPGADPWAEFSDAELPPPPKPDSYLGGIGSELGDIGSAIFKPMVDDPIGYAGERMKDMAFPLRQVPEMLSGMGEQHMEQFGKAEKASREGKTGESIARKAIGSIPLAPAVFGSAMDSYSEGRPKEAAGRLTAQAGLALAPGGAGKAVKGAKRAGTVIKGTAKNISRPNAADWALGTGTAMVASPATGAKVVAAKKIFEGYKKFRAGEKAALPKSLPEPPGRTMTGAEPVQPVHHGESLGQMELPPPPTKPPAPKASGTGYAPSEPVTTTSGWNPMEGGLKPPPGMAVEAPAANPYAAQIAEIKAAILKQYKGIPEATAEDMAVNAVMEQVQREAAMAEGLGSGFEGFKPTNRQKNSGTHNWTRGERSGGLFDQTVDPNTATPVQTLPGPPPMSIRTAAKQTGLLESASPSLGQGEYVNTVLKRAEDAVGLNGKTVAEGYSELLLPGGSEKVIYWGQGGKVTDAALLGLEDGKWVLRDLGKSGKGMPTIKKALWDQEVFIDPSSISDGLIKMLKRMEDWDSQP